MIHAMFYTAIILSLLASAPLHAQDIEATLSGSTAGEGFTVLNSGSGKLFSVRGNGRVGIGTTTPSAGMHIISNDGFLATGTYSSGSLPISGAGTRMMWYPKKAAFRVGGIDGTQWNDALVGGYSCALGLNNTASGAFSMAINIGTEASGWSSLAIGAYTIASGSGAFAAGRSCISSGTNTVAMGQNNTASGAQSIALGLSCDATGSSAIALGNGCKASGGLSVSMGGYTTASEFAATALGYNTVASGKYSFAAGYEVSTNGKEGAFMFGDHSTSTTMNATASNRYYARFDNGYVLYTKADRTTGMFVFNGGNSWSSFSDSTRKENYHPADAERMLSSFSTLRLGSWNYKGDDRRHYGPMAQEWFAAFGDDGIGSIGDDTTLATADVDGVLCIAVQALEKRTTQARTSLSSHEQQIKALRTELTEKDSRIAELQKQLAEQRQSSEKRFSELEAQQNAQQGIIGKLVRRLEMLRPDSEQRLVNHMEATRH